MAALPPGFPKNTTSQGALMELMQWMIATQSIAITANPQLNRIVDSSRTDDIAKLFTFSGAIPIETAIGPTGEIESTAKILF